jgi:K+-sensing histidine kinase KdpD
MARAFGLATHHERQLLLERLSKIQRSISHRAPLQEVLDAITSGAYELMGDEVVGLRLVDPEDPEFVTLVSAVGVTPEQMKTLRRGSTKEGAGGRAIAENRLVIIDDYEHAPTAIAVLASDRLQAAMAAPVREYGKVVGSLVVATYKTGRRYSASEQEAMLSLAEHASLALTDAKTVEAMREAEHAKDMFLAMVSHELKTPLTVIMGALRTLQKHLMTMRTEVREELMNSAVNRGIELQRLIDRLLQGARAELAETSVARRREFLPNLVDEATRGFEQQRPLELGRVPSVFVYADRSVIHKVLGILLENAVSHSPEDSTVKVEAVVADPSISLSVSNRGELPPSTERDSLFLPFQRGPLASSSGVGLGLYIASRLAHAIGGDLGVDSQNGEVTFTFKFPAGT